MALKSKTTFLIVLLLVFIFISPSSGLVEGFRESQYHHPRDLLYKDGMKMKMRKLLSHGFELDYDDAGPNPKHTRKPGKGT